MISDSPVFLSIVLVVAVAFGATIGLVESWILYRDRLTLRVKLWSVVLGIVGFLSGGFLAGWAGDHEAFENGRRLDVAPWGENLWLRNRISEHAFLISVLFPTLLIVIGYAVFGRKRVRSTVHPGK